MRQNFQKGYKIYQFYQLLSQEFLEISWKTRVSVLFFLLNTGHFFIKILERGSRLRSVTIESEKTVKLNKLSQFERLLVQEENQFLQVTVRNG